MKLTGKKLTYTFLLILLIGTFLSCKEVNQSPVITFKLPIEDTLIDRSSRVNFEVIANDPDGNIKQVNFHLNSNPTSKVDHSYPYKVFFDFDSEEHDGTNIVTAIAHDFDGGKAMVQRKLVMNDFRNQWLGNYEGEYRYYSMYPVASPGLYFKPELGTHMYNVIARINKSQNNQDDFLAISLENIDTIEGYWDLQFNQEGQAVYYEYFENTGGSFRRITYTFEGDSLHIIHEYSYGTAGDVIRQYGLRKVE